MELLFTTSIRGCDWVFTDDPYHVIGEKRAFVPVADAASVCSPLEVEVETMQSRVQVAKDGLLWVMALLFALLIYTGLILSAAFIQRRKSVARAADGGVDWPSQAGLVGGERFRHA